MEQTGGLMNKDMAMDADMQNKMDQARKDMPASLAKR